MTVVASPAPRNLGNLHNLGAGFGDGSEVVQNSERMLPH